MNNADENALQFVQDYMSEGIICVPSTSSIRQAASLMREHNISSLLVQENDAIVGIVTDRDLRNRALAEGLGVDAAIQCIMTPDLIKIDTATQIHEAQMIMMSHAVHHLPVFSSEQPVGMITLSDLLRASSIEPLSLSKGLHSAKNLDELIQLAQHIPSLGKALIERNTPARDYSEIISSLYDTITQRLLDLAQADLGKAPCALAWLSFGSQARRELSLSSDQDNALVLAEELNEEGRRYFKALAQFVNDGLAACGLRLCPGDIMASNDRWRMSIEKWCQQFSTWIEQPSPKALMHVSIFFDMHCVAGDCGLVKTLQAHVLKKAQANTIFQALMCSNALQHVPALGLFNRLIFCREGTRRGIDLKKRGSIAIVDIARNYALAAGSTELNTVKRLQDASRRGNLSESLAKALIEAHEYIVGLRLKGQSQDYISHVQALHLTDAKQLSILARRQLKQALLVIKEAQAAMRQRFA